MQKNQMIKADEALLGKNTPLVISDFHAVNHHRLKAPFPEGFKKIVLGMGCFWGAERLLWQIPGVYVTAAGYAGGFTKNPTYEEICSGSTGHAEVVLVAYDPAKVSLKKILTVFFEEHNPTEGMRQGNDIGTNYRSAIYTDNEEDLILAKDMMKTYGKALLAHGFGTITTEIASDVPFYYAEDYHQQYLYKNPNGYCGLKGSGVSCLI